MNRAADPKRVSRFLYPEERSGFPRRQVEPFVFGGGAGRDAGGGRGESRRRRRGRMRPPLFVPGGAERLSVSAGVSACPFSMVRRRSPRWVGGSRVVRLVETAGQAVPVVFLCPGGGGRAPLALRLRGGTGGVCSRSDLRPRRSGSGAVSRGREPNNGSGITFYGRKSSDFSK